MSDTSFYNRLENLLTYLLESLGDVLSINEKQEVHEFIQHGEYGIALETLCSIIKEEKKKISEHHIDRIRDLQNLMQIKHLPTDDEM